MVTKKYGVVYTPDRLAEFTLGLIKAELDENNIKATSILDPACGERALLKAAMKCFGKSPRYYGIDVDENVIENSEEADFTLICNDAILPENIKQKTATYWKRKFKDVSVIIANPPWSSEKIYSREQLENAGFTLTAGQYDSYVLFVELAYELLPEGGIFGFIVPDSIFDAQNELLRRNLARKTQITLCLSAVQKLRGKEY